MATFKTEITSVDEHMKQLEPLCTVGGNVNSGGATTMEYCMDIPQNSRNRNTITKRFY